MNCYEIRVDTTNGISDTFKSGGKYYDCCNGFVFVFAKDAPEAAKQIPEAVTIRLLGKAFAGNKS